MHSDWGAFFAELIYIHFKTRLHITKMVLMDVGDGGDIDDARRGKYIYQMFGVHIHSVSS